MASSPPSAAEQIKQYQLQPQLFIAIPSIFIVLTSFAVALRIHVRAIMLKTFGADDWLLLVAFVSPTANFQIDMLADLERPSSWAIALCS